MTFTHLTSDIWLLNWPTDDVKIFISISILWSNHISQWIWFQILQSLVLVQDGEVILDSDHLTFDIWLMSFYILHIIFYISHFTSYISHLTSYILHFTFNISTVYILPLKFDIYYLTFDICHLTCGIWHLTFDIWHLAFDIWHLTFVIWHNMVLSNNPNSFVDGFCGYLSNLSLITRSVGRSVARWI